MKAQMVWLFKDKSNKLVFVSDHNYLLMVDNYAPTDSTNAYYTLYGTGYNVMKGGVPLIKFYEKATKIYQGILMTLLRNHNKDLMYYVFSYPVWWRKLVKIFNKDFLAYDMMLRDGSYYCLGIYFPNDKVRVPAMLFDHIQKIENAKDIYADLADIWERSSFATDQSEASVPAQSGPGSNPTSNAGA